MFSSFVAGVTVGDIGPKLGFQNADNGFLMFDHVRIPRDQLMGKYVEATNYFSPAYLI